MKRDYISFVVLTKLINPELWQQVAAESEAPMKGFFGSLFDFNHDGILDRGEQAVDFLAFSHMMDSMEEQDEEDDCDLSGTDLDALELAGLDQDELEMMDEDERREALEEAGLDPDDYE